LSPGGGEATPLLRRRTKENEKTMELTAFDRSRKLSELRNEGFLPAVVYNKDLNRSIYVERKAFDKVFRQVSTHGLIQLTFEGGEVIDVIVKAVNMDKRKRIPAHADFYIVSDAPIEVKVPVHVHGEARGVRLQGGVLDIVMHQVEIKVSPKNIPDEVTVDVTNLGLNESIHVRDLVLPEGVKLVSDGAQTVVVVHATRNEATAPTVVPVPA
jgi:large subunit ribosomal protein L25